MSFLPITRSAVDCTYKNYSEEMKIRISVPGIGEIGSMTLIAEIGNVNDFSSGDKLASWLGIVPCIYQYADKLRTRSITKSGSENARGILVQIAHAESRSRNSALKPFLIRKKAIIGAGKAIIAHARKIVVLSGTC